MYFKMHVKNFVHFEQVNLIDLIEKKNSRKLCLITWVTWVGVGWQEQHALWLKIAFNVT